jgi:NTP pyrophosphatase (non-canonical NTP hydrolase)
MADSAEPGPLPADLTVRELQSTVDDWIRSIGVRYFSELTNLAVLMEEVGELARIFARTFGDQSFKKNDPAYNLSDEMADVLFVLVCLANQTGVDLEAAIRENLAKKTARDATRHLENPKLQPPRSEGSVP